MRRFSLANVRVVPAAFVPAAFVAIIAATAQGQPPAPPGTEPSAAARYVQQIEGNLGPLASYRGTATLRAYGDVEGTFNAAFARAQPDRGRLEVSSPLTGTALVVTAAAGELLVYYPLDEIAVVGSDDARGIAALPAGRGGLSDSLNLLAGRPPLYTEDVAAGNLEISVAEEGGAVTLTWLEPGGARLQQLTLAGNTGLPVNFRFYEDDAATADVTYDDWRDHGGAAVPFALTVKTADALVEISVKKFDADVDVPGEAFSTTPPAGVEVVETWPAAFGDDAEDERN
jgi:outer membrane biogenesis lipoprotein LolB